MILCVCDDVRAVTTIVNETIIYQLRKEKMPFFFFSPLAINWGLTEADLCGHFLDSIKSSPASVCRGNIRSFCLVEEIQIFRKKISLLPGWPNWSQHSVDIVLSVHMFTKIQNVERHFQYA